MVDPEDVYPEELMPGNPDRPRGILTRRERRYYLGQSDIEPGTQAERSIRQSVREHLTHSILDFTILYQQLEARDLDAVMSATVEIDGENMPTAYAHRSATDMIAFLWRHVDNEYGFERQVIQGIERAVQHAGWSARVDVDIDVKLQEPTGDIRSRLEDRGPEAVSATELRTLLDAGEITALEHAKYLVEKEEDSELRRETLEELNELMDEDAEDNDDGL